MNKFKKALVVVGGSMLSAIAMAEGESAAFDPSTFLGTANTTVTTIVTAVGTLLATALGLYLAFVGYRKAREALNKA